MDDMWSKCVGSVAVNKSGKVAKNVWEDVQKVNVWGGRGGGAPLRFFKFLTFPRFGRIVDPCDGQRFSWA